MLKSTTVDYLDGDTLLEAYVAYDDQVTDKRPAVLVSHDWSGKNAFACQKADQLAQLGYVGFALDMYGKGKIGHTKEEKAALMQPILHDRGMLAKRILAALAAISKVEQADANRIGAIGFCFGGLCVLDLARSGAKVKGVVSVHGLLNPPDHTPHSQPISSRILVLHGFDDPMVSPDQVIAFANEMTTAKAIWELDIYGHTMHAFTNPDANDPGFGTVYNPNADSRSWEAMVSFFNHTL